MWKKALAATLLLGFGIPAIAQGLNSTGFGRAGDQLQNPLNDINAQTGDYTLVASDAGKWIRVTSTSQQTITIPLDSAVNFTIGTEIRVVQVDSGQVEIGWADGVTVQSKSTMLTSGQGAVLTLKKAAANTWDVTGDLSRFALDATSSDVHSAFSMRQLLSSYTGPLIQIRRSTDNSTMDVYPNDSGDLDISSVRNWLAIDFDVTVGSTAAVNTWYDQSGNGRDMTQTTNGFQPDFIFAGMNNRPTIEFGPEFSDVVLQSSPDSASLMKDAEAGHLVSAVMQLDDTSSIDATWWSEGGSAFPLRYYLRANNTTTVNVGQRDSDTSESDNFTISANSDGVPVLLEFSSASGIMSVYRNNVASTSNTQSYDPSDFTSPMAVMAIGARYYADGLTNAEWTGDIAEVYFADAVPSVFRRQAVAQSSMAYWGVN